MNYHERQLSFVNNYHACLKTSLEVIPVNFSLGVLIPPLVITVGPSVVINVVGASVEGVEVVVGGDVVVVGGNVVVGGMVVVGFVVGFVVGANK